MDMAAVECLSYAQLIRLIEHDVRTADKYDDKNFNIQQQINKEEEEDLEMFSSATSSPKMNQIMNCVNNLSSISMSSSSSSNSLNNQNSSGLYKEQGYFPGRRLESNNLYSYYKQIADKSKNYLNEESEI